jgi:hypothetical protein
MSIIHDALEKVQENLRKKSGSVAAINSTPEDQKPAQDAAASPPPPTAVPGAPAVSPAKKNWDTVILLEILALCLVVGILFVFQPQIFRSLYRSKPVKSDHISLPQSPQRPLSTPAAPSSISVRPAATQPVLMDPAGEPLILNGIMMLEKNKIVALINDEIYKSGDSVQGRKITNITLENVELSDGQETVTLQIRPKKNAP